MIFDNTCYTNHLIILFCKTGFVAECVSSHKMVDTVEFQEGDWTDYDESSKQSVGIYGVKTKFRKAK